MKVSAGTRGTSYRGNRQVIIMVTGLAHNSYVSSSDCLMRVPYTRMSDTLRLVKRLGGKVTRVNVSGGGASSVPPLLAKQTNLASTERRENRFPFSP